MDNSVYVVVFVTDVRKENETKVHRVFRSKDAAIAEAKKFTDPPDAFRDREDEALCSAGWSAKAREDEESRNRSGIYKWEHTGFAYSVDPPVYSATCKVAFEHNATYEGGAANMSWTPVVVVVKSTFTDE